MTHQRILSRAVILPIAAFMIGLPVTALAVPTQDGTWRAALGPLNNSGSHGTATITIKQNQATIQIDANGTAPSIAHLQHFHGFAKGGQKAGCPGPDSDTNNDGVIDIIETEAAAGTTMVPFDTEPAALDMLGGKFPVADAKGTYTYKKTVPLASLVTAFNKAFPDQQLDLDRRVVMLHGVAERRILPKTAASLGGVPTRVTLPIVCGVLQRVSE